MGERYKIIKEFTQNEWLESCPLKVEKGQIILDFNRNELLAQLKLFNLSSKSIKAAYILLKCYDEANDLLNENNYFAYTNLEVDGKNRFGNNIPIYLTDNKTANVKIIFTKVVFSDGEVWRNTNNDIGIMLPIQNEIKKDDKLYPVILKELSIFNCLPSYSFECDDNYWRCVCGQANSYSNSSCLYCGLEREWLNSHLSHSYLEAEYNRLLKEETERKLQEKEEERRRVAEEKVKKIELEDKKNKRTKRIKKISIAILVPLLLLVVLYLILTGGSMAQLAREKNTEKIEKLVSLGKDINLKDNNNETALGAAVQTKDKEMVDFLLSKGADVKESRAEIQGFIDKAYEEKDYDFISFMIDNKIISTFESLSDGTKLIHAAIEDSDLDTLKFLVDSGFNINTVNSSGQTPLEAAASLGNNDIKNYLLGKKVSGTISENITLLFCSSDYIDSTSLYSSFRSKRKSVKATKVTSYLLGDSRTEILIGKYRYDGDFKDGSITGKGTLYDVETDIPIYSGFWKDGLFSGKGELNWKDSHITFIDGDFVEGNPVSYKRYYRNGLLNDTGTITSDGLCTSDKYGTKQYK